MQMRKASPAGELLGIVSMIWNHPFLTGLVILLFTPPFFPLVVYFSPLLMSTALCVVALVSVGSQMEKIKADGGGPLEVHLGRERGVGAWVERDRAGIEAAGLRYSSGDRNGETWIGRTDPFGGNRGPERTPWTGGDRAVAAHTMQSQDTPVIDPPASSAGESDEDWWDTWVKEYESRSGWGEQEENEESTSVPLSTIRQESTPQPSNPRVSVPPPPPRRQDEMLTVKESDLRPHVPLPPIRTGRDQRDAKLVDRQTTMMIPTKNIGDTGSSRSHVSEMQALQSIEKLLHVEMGGQKMKKEFPAEVVRHLKTAGLGTSTEANARISPVKEVQAPHQLSAKEGFSEGHGHTARISSVKEVQALRQVPAKEVVSEGKEYTARISPVKEVQARRQLFAKEVISESKGYMTRISPVKDVQGYTSRISHAKEMQARHQLSAKEVVSEGTGQTVEVSGKNRNKIAVVTPNIGEETPLLRHLKISRVEKQTRNVAYSPLPLRTSRSVGTERVLPPPEFSPRLLHSLQPLPPKEFSPRMLQNLKPPRLGNPVEKVPQWVYAGTPERTKVKVVTTGAKQLERNGEKYVSTPEHDVKVSSQSRRRTLAQSPTVNLESTPALRRHDEDIRPSASKTLPVEVRTPARCLKDNEESSPGVAASPSPSVMQGRRGSNGSRQCASAAGSPIVQRKDEDNLNRPWPLPAMLPRDDHVSIERQARILRDLKLRQALEPNCTPPREFQPVQSEEGANIQWGRSHSARRPSPRKSRRRLEPRRVVNQDHNDMFSLKKSMSLRNGKAIKYIESSSDEHESSTPRACRRGERTIKPLVWRSRSLQAQDDSD